MLNVQMKRNYDAYCVENQLNNCNIKMKENKLL